MADSRVLITGAAGNLGQDLLAFLQRSSQYTLIGTTRDQLNLTSPEAELMATLDAIRPDIIINPAAFTAVDAAESDFETAMQVNCHGPQVLAQWAEQNGAYLVHISTDYVFDGTKGKPYTPADLTNPVSRYGESKEAGEMAVLSAHPTGSAVLRTSWLFGSGQKNFVPFVVNAAKNQTPVNIANDQWGTPTWTVNLAQMIFETLLERPSGLLHATGYGRTSRYEQALMLCHLLKLPTEFMTSVPTSAFNFPARRPTDSSMQSSYSSAMHWEEATSHYLVATSQGAPC